MDPKNHRWTLLSLSALFLALVALSFWQSSLDFGDFRPENTTAAIVLWSMLTLVVLGVLALGFLLFRSLIKLYIERRQGRLGSKIKTRLVAGALVVSIVPTVAMVVFSWAVMSRTFDKWFGDHSRTIVKSSAAMTEELNGIMRRKIEADAAWIASMPEVAQAFLSGPRREDLADAIVGFADRVQAQYVGVLPAGENRPGVEVSGGKLIQGPVAWRIDPEDASSDVESDYVWAVAPVRVGGREEGRVIVVWPIPDGIQAQLAVMDETYQEYLTLERVWREVKYSNLSLMALITVFVLFIATWLSLFFAKQISRPIQALVEATAEVSSGRLDHRVEATAIDELGGLICSFNDMTQRLEQQTRALQNANAEVESRRRFINAILESIRPGVISINSAGDILKTNPAVAQILPEAASAKSIDELFSGDDREEIRYMLNRASRIGVATRELEVQRDGRILHLAVTATALEKQTASGARGPSRFVVVIEDATELLRAQKSAAWNEVARRVAHEIKNPLTPIALSAERIERLLERLGEPVDADERRSLRDRMERSTRTIVGEVQSLRRLVDEFSELARFPQAEPGRADLNEVVREALHVFEGRLGDITLRTRFDPSLPSAWVDRELFKRVIINLVDNAAEAVQGRYVREIEVATGPGPLPDRLELTVSDSGPGVSPEDKDRLFLPYFSTKNRGTGLGLAIVNRIVSEHGGVIRVEDNRPSGSRFIVEVPLADSTQPVVAEAAVRSGSA